MCDVFSGHEYHILAEAKNSRKQYWTVSKNHIVKSVILDFQESVSFWGRECNKKL